MPANTYGVLGGIGGGMMTPLGKPTKRARNRPRLYRVVDLSAAASDVIVFQRFTAFELFAWAGGGSGRYDTSGSNGAGGGAAGGALRRAMIATPGQRLAYSIGAGGAAVSSGNGNAGGDTVITFPDGLIGRAFGGGGGQVGATSGGGYQITGQMVGASGGSGGAGAAGGATGSTGGTGADGGGAGGAGGVNLGGGGGAAGFASYLEGLTYGAGGGDSTAGASRGAGGGGRAAAGLTSGAGAAGALLVYLFEL